MAKPVLSQLLAFLNRLGLLPTYLTRNRAAARYLRGSGMEIGPLDHPLRVPKGVHVTYVDYVTREMNLQRYPGLDPGKVVAAQLIEDGFTLASVQAASQDFIVANHVLEHTTNPIQALVNWERILKDNGVMFLSVPNGQRCFDKGRPANTVEHFRSDYEAVKAGDLDAFANMNRDHYRQWLEISVPGLNRAVGASTPILTDAEKEARIEKMFSEREEIHYHVFSRQSITALMEYVITHHLPGLKLLQITCSITGAEFIIIVQKQPGLPASAA